MVEQQVEVEILAAHLQRVLAADEGEADSRLEQELSNVFEQAAFRSRSSVSSLRVRKSKV